MAIPDRQRLPSVDPRFRRLVTDDGSLTLEDVATGDTFHSGCGAATECQSVYLENSGVERRMRDGQRAAVLEIGFGTGLAFLLTADEAIRCEVPLEYTALETDLLGVDCLRQVLELPAGFAAALGPLRDSLLTQLAPAGGEPGAEVQIALAANVHLRLLITTAVGWRGIADSVDAVYFDPFSPASAPMLWSTNVFESMFACLRGGGRLVSYCVNSEVRRRIEAVGFEVRRVPGPPGGKREVLVATKPANGNRG